MKDRKKRGAKPVPQVFPSMQSEEVFMQSYMILFQSSPVEIEKSNSKLRWKLVKFFHSSITFPSVTLKKSELPKTAIMKKMSISKMNTLISDDTDIWMVFKSDYKPLYLPASLKTRLTLSTRSTLAN